MAKPNNQDALPLCRHCGARGYLIEDRVRGTFKVKCTGCEMQTPAREFRTDCVEIWSGRTPSDAVETRAPVEVLGAPIGKSQSVQHKPTSAPVAAVVQCPNCWCSDLANTSDGGKRCLNCKKFIASAPPATAINAELLAVAEVVDHLAPPERIAKAMELLELMGNEHPVAIPADDPRLNPFCGDFFPMDTFNLLCEIEWIDQIGSDDLDNYRAVLLPKGCAAIARAKGEV